MAIEITEISGFDTIAASRIVLNQNFSKLKGAIDDIQTYINTSDKAISGIQSLNIKKGDTNVTDTLITTNGSGAFGGNISAGGSITGNTINSAAGINLTSGNILLNSANSKLINKGDTILSREIVLNDFTSSAASVADELYFANSSGTSNLIYSGNTAVAGWVSLLGRSAIILDWTNFVSVADAQFYLHRLKLRATGNSVGQTVKIIAKINEDVVLPLHSNDEGYGYFLLRDTLAYTTGNPINNGICFTKSYQSVDLCFDGTNWLITNLYGATLV